jgi:hypothetical protein
MSDTKDGLREAECLISEMPSSTPPCEMTRWYDKMEILVDVGLRTFRFPISLMLLKDSAEFFRLMSHVLVWTNHITGTDSVLTVVRSSHYTIFQVDQDAITPILILGGLSYE